MSKYKVRLMLDSGAYTAWGLNKQVDLTRYIDWLGQNQQWLDSYVALDIIPGVRGKQLTVADMEAGAKASWSAFVTMRNAGLNPMPVYHLGERLYWLDKMIDSGAGYIGIGAAGMKDRQFRYDQIFAHLCGRRGFPEARIHGFAMTSPSLLYRYPWHSVDSTTWGHWSRYGCVQVPVVRGGVERYDVPPHIVHVSDLSAQSGSLAIDAAVLKQPSQYGKLGTVERKVVDKYFASLGLDYVTLSTSGDARIEANVGYFKRMADTYAPNPFISRGDAGGLFDGTPGIPERDGVAINTYGMMRMVFSAGTSANYAKVMLKLGCRDQLISYWELKDRNGFDLGEYVRTGLLPERLGRAVKPKTKAPCTSVAGPIVPKLPKRRAKSVGWRGLEFS